MIARVFPRRTNATPDDDMAYVDPAPLAPPMAEEIHISVTFSWDLPKMRRLFDVWSEMGIPVKIGGPAASDAPDGVFIPGMYVKRGYVITSRGCPNRCWFCTDWKRNGPVRELPITEGWNLLDSNILACSEQHVLNVMDMLRRQKKQPQFTGGIEARLLDDWSAEALRSVRPKQLFMAYDTPDDWEPLVRAAGLLWKAGFTKASHSVRAYVLCGYPKDTIGQAEDRMTAVKRLGIIPMAMLWRKPLTTECKPPEWRAFQRRWARPVMICGGVN